MFETDSSRRPAAHAFNCDRSRAWACNFIVPEHQSGPGGQPPYFHHDPKPGELRRMTCASIARGADSLLYFRWRTCRFWFLMNPTDAEITVPAPCRPVR